MNTVIFIEVVFFSHEIRNESTDVLFLVLRNSE